MSLKKRRNIRKKSTEENDLVESTQQALPQSPSSTVTKTSASSSENDNNSEVTLTALIDFQKSRRRKQGIDIQALAKGEPKSKKKKLKLGSDWSVQSEKGTDQQNDDEFGLKKSTMLGSFTKQTNALDVNKHMMKYIEENLKKRKQQELGIETSTGDSEDVAEGAEGNSLDPLDSLYQIPDHLRVVSEKPVEEGSLSLSTAMLTSIPEVDLGMSSRIKNIEETEKAKRRLEEGTTTPKQARATQDDPLAGLRYQRYRDISERHATATDAAVAERFKQRFKR